MNLPPWRRSAPPQPEPAYGLFPLPLGRAELQPDKPFTLSCRSQAKQRLRPERLLIMGGDWKWKGVCTLEGLYIEGAPLGPSQPMPLDFFDVQAFGTRLATDKTIAQGQLFELRGYFRQHEQPARPRYWSHRAGPYVVPRRPWPPEYWCNLAGSPWPSLQAVLLVRMQSDDPLLDVAGGI